jgi:Leucine-rich repeat (LRR) protein
MKIYILVIICALSASCALATTKVLKCSYEIFIEDQYGCVIKDQDIEDDIDIEFDLSGRDVSEMEKFTFSTKMSYVPTQVYTIFPKIISITFEACGFKEWKPEYLAGATNVKRLYIWSNEIRHFDDAAFVEAPQLEYLWIYDHNLKTINPNMFEGSSQLKSLDFRGNDFSANLPLGVFDRVAETLEYLSLSNAQLTKIPEGMFINIAYLKDLNLKGNDLEPIDAVLTFSEELKEVYVGEFFAIRYQP